MNYKEFKDIHKGQKVIVSGCGTSATDLKNPQDFFTIGVNDIGRLYSSNYLVVLNDKASFKPDRWEWVEKSQCPHIFTHIKGLAVKEESKVLLQLGRYGGCDLDKEAVDYTSNSPFVGCIIAAYMGFTKIGILGVDFTLGHFFENTGEHTLSKKINVINQEYILLKQAMDRKGIELVNLSAASRIQLPKQTLSEF
jgi:hypothetical protein